jgi:NAD(P)H-flavin reductase
MDILEGRVSEVRLEYGQRLAWIDCPQAAIPAPGRYVMAWAPDDVDAPLGTALFAQETVLRSDSAPGFLAAPPVPHTWEPGTRLQLRGPSGRGFDLPVMARRLALAALGDTAGRLLPLVNWALAQNMAVAFFTDLALPPLPSAVEISPLHAAPEALGWADFLALDLPLDAVSRLPSVLGLSPEVRKLPCPSQALVLSDMPCGGLAACGACAVTLHHGWKLTCQDGPVFDTEVLL